MNVRNILLEGRKDDFLNKFKDKFSKEELKDIFLASRDLASNHKYLMFLGNVITPDNVGEDIVRAKNAIEKFIKYQQVIEKKDINQYKTLKDIEDEIKKHENKVRRSVKKVDGADIVYEDDRYTVVSPLNHETSCYYGAGTKWCTAARSGSGHYYNYTTDGRLFYIIDKKGKTSDRFYKVALLNKFDGGQTFYDAPDKSFSSGWILGTEEWNKINGAIQEYLEDEYPREMEIFKDKKRAEEERKRIQRQREMARRAERLRRAEDRRENDEWNRDELGSDEAIKANAVFEVVEDEFDVDEENGEDIYMLDVGPNNHYGLDTFVWLGEDGYDTTWAVGDWDEAYAAGKEYFEGLIDDMGVESFNRDFLEGHIDLDTLEEYVRDVYENDVYENPESYFDEEDRELSREQERQIEKLEEEMEELQELIDYTDDTDEVDESMERIEDIELEIEEIKDNPDGEYNEEKVEEAVDDRVSYYRDNPMEFINELGLDLTNFIDQESLIEDVIDTDGLGNTLSSYDGDEREVLIGGQWYFIYRVE